MCRQMNTHTHTHTHTIKHCSILWGHGTLWKLNKRLETLSQKHEQGTFTPQLALSFREFQNLQIVSCGYRLKANPTQLYCNEHKCLGFGVWWGKVCASALNAHCDSRFCALCPHCEPLFCPHREAYLSWWRHRPHRIIPLLHDHPPELLCGHPRGRWGHRPYSPGEWGGQSAPELPYPVPAPSKRLREDDQGYQGHMCPHLCRDWPLNPLPVFLPLIRVCYEPASLPSVDATSLGKSHLHLTSFCPSAALLNSRRCFLSPINIIPQVMYTYIHKYVYISLAK